LLPVVVPLAVLVALAWGCVATAYAGGAQGLPALLAANASRLWMAALGGSAVLLAALAGARAAPLVAVLAVADLVVAHGDLNPTAPASVLAARPEVLERIERTPSTRLYVWDYGVRTRTMKSRYDMLPVLAETPSGGPRPLGKMLALNAYLYPPLPGRWGLSGSYDPDFLGLDPGPLASLNLLLRVVEGTPAWGRLLRVGSVDYVIALHTEGQEELVHVATVRGLFSRPIELFRNPAPLPRTYAVGTSRIADGDDALRALVDPQFDPEREVVLASGPRLAAPAFRGTSRLLESRPDHVVLETDFESEGLAVLVDGYDPGWSAALDGAATPVYRANVAFRAVRAPAGRHRIELRYRPRSVAIGLALGAASLLAAALLLRARS
jgi:hypothetical protein